MKFSVVILAGGFGTRMSEQFPGIPKPMIPVNETPILEHLVNECIKYNRKDILIVLHYMPEIIKNYFGDGSRFGVNIKYHIEEVPLGTGGALLSVLNRLNDVFFVLYADVYTSVNLNLFAEFHYKTSADISIVVHPNDHPEDSDLVILNDENKVKSFSSHPHDSSIDIENLVNAALYIINKKSISSFRSKTLKFDIAQILFPELLKIGTNIYAYLTVEYIKDMGTPERLIRVEGDIDNGIVNSRLSNHSRKAIFIDRDGTINIEDGYLKNLDKMVLIPDSGKAIKKINKSKFLAVCITNQPVIARGECSIDMLNLIHKRMSTLLGKNNSYLDSIFYCPHHPDAGFDGEIKSLKLKCECRKPGVGMLLDAKKALNIDLSKSWMIGDRTADIAMASSKNLYSSLVRTGASGSDMQYPSRPTIITNDLNESVNFILNFSEIMIKEAQNIVSKLKDVKYIFITGQSRTGKTSFASILKKEYADFGINAHIIELDRFLKKTRDEKDIINQRYDNEGALDLLKKISCNKLFEYNDVSLDHFNKKFIDCGSSILKKNDIFIIEGLTSFNLMQNFKNKFSTSIFIHKNNSFRYKKFLEKYSKHSLEHKNIDILWNKRSKAEDIEILQHKKTADHFIDLD